MMQLLFLEAIQQYKTQLLSRQQKTPPDNSLFGAILSGIQSTAMDYAKHRSLIGPAAFLYDVGDISMLRQILLNLELPYFLITNRSKEQLQENILKIPDFQHLLKKMNAPV